eukprot:314664_1
MALIIAIILSWMTCYGSEECTTNNSSSLFSFPIDNLSNPVVSNVISNAVESLNVNKFYFKIPGFLSESGLSTLQELILSEEYQSKATRRNLQKTIFGHKPDYINFVNETINGEQIQHPRNKFFQVNLLNIRKKDLSQIIIDMFEYEPLLNFLKEIMVQSGKFNDLYLSNDTDGSVYVYLYNNGNFGEWHFDEHPFTCVYMIIKPDIGGRYRYYYDDTMNKHKHNASWDVIGQILNNETYAMQQYVNAVDRNEGDMICHMGNITFHQTEQSFNNVVNNQYDIVRAIMVFSYADYDGFVHDECRVANDECDDL